jgi:hypothetical protein
MTPEVVKILQGIQTGIWFCAVWLALLVSIIADIDIQIRRKG